MSEDLAAYFFKVLTRKKTSPQAFKNLGLSAGAAPAKTVLIQAEKVDEAAPPVTESSKTSSSEGKGR